MVRERAYLNQNTTGCSAENGRCWQLGRFREELNVSISFNRERVDEVGDADHFSNERESLNE